MPSLRFRDALKFKQMFTALIGEWDRGPCVHDVKTCCLSHHKDEESWEKEQLSPLLPTAPFARRTSEALGSEWGCCSIHCPARDLQQGWVSFPFPQE